MRVLVPVVLVCHLAACGDSATAPPPPVALAGTYQLVAADDAPLPRPMYGIPGGDTTRIYSGMLELVPPDSGLLTVSGNVDHAASPPQPFTGHAPMRFLVQGGRVFLFPRKQAQPPASDTGMVLRNGELRWPVNFPTVPALQPPPPLIREFLFRKTS